MSSPAVDLRRLDSDIWRAWQEVLTARGVWARYPTADSIAGEQAATARLNKLLEFRHTATHPCLTST